ncbi:polyprenyl diphosphate synthase [Streptomyces sp. NPDC006365]|uniref:polyprenyl diphosphate synthase n=1 Tax=Streptomyces sp. NPDC006365 TaxID=3364744 RepID=UPI003685E6DA
MLSTDPCHVACILDGNGRWAEARGLVRRDGHHHGADPARRIVETADDMGLEWLSMYVFSTENWARPTAEVALIMRAIEKFIEANLESWHRRGIRIRYLGQSHHQVPLSLRSAMARSAAMTASNTGMTVTVALNHGGHSDLVHAVRSIVAAGVPADQISERTLAAHLPHPDMPPVDLLIRTSGEMRLSGFLLWHMAYAELVFLPDLWPDMTPEKFRDAIETYRHRSRRFGKVATR